MRFNVAQLLRGPVGGVRDVIVDEPFTPEEEQALERVKGSLRLMRTDKGVWASGYLDSRCRGICSRCLSEFFQTARFRMDEVFFPTVDVRTGVRLPSPEEPDSLTIDENHTLDITEAVRQYTIMNLPMKPLCKEDCAGLCPACGVNRNQQACSCEITPRDLRWSRLIDLLGSK